MKIIKFILFLTLIIIVFTGCKSGNKYYYITGEARNFLEIDTGSFFVFKDSINNTSDTLIVSLNSDKTYWQEFEGGIHTVSEICEINMSSKNKSIDSSYFDLKFKIYGGDNKIFLENIAFTKPDSIIYGFGARLFEDNFITSPYFKFGVNYPIQVHDNLSIYGNQFTRVYENLFKYQDSTSQDFIRTYFSPTNGLVKFEMKIGNFNTTEELVYFNIKRIKK